MTKTIKRLLPAALAVLLAGCAMQPVDSTTTRYRVAFIAKNNRDSEFWDAVFTGAEAAATEYNLQLTITAPDDGDIKESIRPYAMGRIIDVEDFLADYPCDPDGGTLCIELEIEDSLLPWNDRTFNVRFADGHCTMTRDPAEYHLKMGIGTFTTLLLGYKTAERLYELERIEGREEAVERLDDVLFHKIPYISDYI